MTEHLVEYINGNEERFTRVFSSILPLHVDMHDRFTQNIARYGGEAFWVEPAKSIITFSASDLVIARKVNRFGRAREVVDTLYNGLGPEESAEARERIKKAGSKILQLSQPKR